MAQGSCLACSPMRGFPRNRARWQCRILPRPPATSRPELTCRRGGVLFPVSVLESEKSPAVPTRAGYRFGDCRERAVVLSLPRETVLQHKHVVGLTVPSPY